MATGACRILAVGSAWRVFQSRICPNWTYQGRWPYVLDDESTTGFKLVILEDVEARHSLGFVQICT
jgi:hypothetical protein